MSHNRPAFDTRLGLLPLVVKFGFFNRTPPSTTAIILIMSWLLTSKDARCYISEHPHSMKPVTTFTTTGWIALLRLRLYFGIIIDNVVGDPADDDLIGLAIVGDENVVAVSSGTERSTGVVHRILGVGEGSIVFHESETA
jgi:hypothetical protein